MSGEILESAILSKKFIENKFNLISDFLKWYLNQAINIYIYIYVKFILCAKWFFNADPLISRVT
jgi:hypothetical protein